MPVHSEISQRRRRAVAAAKLLDPEDRVNLPADASDLATAIALVNAIKDVLIDLGIAVD
jgi:hypothetical protein